MKTGFAIAVIGAFIYGFLLSSKWHENDYRRGYENGYGAGVAATRPLRDSDHVVTNLLCHYAELSCPKTK